jgi:hypothetical protein
MWLKKYEFPKRLAYRFVVGLPESRSDNLFEIVFNSDLIRQFNYGIQRSVLNCG